jgi:hypothetical protein
MIYLSLSRQQYAAPRRLPARFSLSRWGGTSVYLFLTLSLSLLLFACPDASATPSGSIGVVWSKNDPGQVYSTSGNVGSQAYVHIHFSDTGVMGAPTVTITAQELSGHSDLQQFPAPGQPNTFTFNNGSFPGICPHCGEGSGSHSQFWMTTGFHNGSWQITATVNYTKFPVGQQHFALQPITVNLQNAIVTPTGPQNPDPILWDPDTMEPVFLSANVDLAYRSSLTAIKLEIFDSGQTLRKTVALDRALAPGTNAITYDWYGSQDPPNADTAEKGVYLFKWTVGHSGGEEDYDCEKSSYLTISTPTSEAELVSDDGTTAVYHVSYTLTSTENRPASSGKIDVYDPALNVHYTKALETSDLLPGQHTVTVTMPSPQIAGNLVFLVSAQDNHADKDKGHRQRWALQHNNFLSLAAAAVFGFTDIPTSSTAQWAWGLLRGGWYTSNHLQGRCAKARATKNPADPTNQKPPAEWPNEPISNGTAENGWFALHWSFNIQGPTYWFFFGHGGGGSYAGKLIEFSGKSVLVADKAVTNPSGYTVYSVADFAAGRLSKVYLAVIAACQSGQQDGPADQSGIAGALRAKGVQNTISFARVMNAQMANYWDMLFVKYITVGSIDLNDPNAWKQMMDVYNAAQLAQQKTIEHYQSVWGGEIATKAIYQSFVIFNGTLITVDAE